MQSARAHPSVRASQPTTMNPNTFATVYTPTKGPREGCYNLAVDFKTRIKIVDNQKSYADFMNDLRCKWYTDKSGD